MATNITDANFESLIVKTDGVAFIDFWAPWCGPCRAISPIIDEISVEYEGRVQVYKMNVDENTVVPAKYAIRAIPTMMIFKDGELQEQIVGGVDKEQIAAALDKVLA